MTRTLVVAPNWVGDCVMALPVLEALLASGRRLHTLARAHLLPLLRLVPALAGVVERAATDRETLARIAAGGWDEAVILPNSFRSALLAFRGGIPRRWGYRRDFRGLLLAPAVARPRTRRRHQTEDFRELLEAMEVPPPASWVPRLVLPAEVRAAGAERLERAGIRVGQAPLVGLNPGAEFGPSKRWPLGRYAELATRLRRFCPGARQIILAGPSETWLAVRVYEESAKLHPVVGPDLDLAGLAGVLSHLALLVSNDSGPVHLAAALGVRCLALFGPTDPGRTRPAGEGHQVLYTDRWCSPCFRRRCPLLHHRCLREITVDEVVAACRRVLGPEPATAGAAGDA